MTHKKGRPWNHKEFVEEIKRRNPKIQVTSKYISGYDPISLKCLNKKCNYLWSRRPTQLLEYGRDYTRCPDCIRYMQKKPQKTDKLFNQELKELRKEFPCKIFPTQKYKGAKTHIGFDCRKHKCKFKCKPEQVFYHFICPDLRRQKPAKIRTEKREKKIKADIKKAHSSNVTMIGQYIDYKTHVMFKCKKHNRAWKDLPTYIRQGKQCPVCTSSKPSMYKTKKVKLGNKFVWVQGYEPQALKILQNRKVKPTDIEVNDVPIIDYIWNGKRKYHPDFFIEKTNTIIEVKSDYTLCPNLKGFNRNKAKAKATLKAGFKLELITLNKQEEIVKIPKRWYNLKYSEMLKILQ